MVRETQKQVGTVADVFMGTILFWRTNRSSKQHWAKITIQGSDFPFVGHIDDVPDMAGSGSGATHAFLVRLKEVKYGA